MKMKKKYSGVVVPAVTPLTAGFKLDHGAVERMLHRFREHDVKPFILGTTGESASLPLSLKYDYIKKASSLKQTGELLYAGISSNCLDDSVELAKFCFQCGVDVVAATLPSYYLLNAVQMKKYFEQLAEQVQGPLIIYNIPATTHMSIPLELIEELSHHENIVGTKDSERSEERLKQSIALWAEREDFCHFLGWAARSAEGLIAGSDGLIPGTGNLHPGLYEEMAAAVKAGQTTKALELQRLSDLFGDIYQKGRSLGESLAALKWLMKEAGLCDRYVMPPLQLLSSHDEHALTTSLEEILTKEGIKLSKSFSNA